MGRIELFDRLEVRKLMWSRCLIDLHDSNPSSMSELGQSRHFDRAPITFAVGTRVTSRPPHRSVRAQFGHTAPTSGM
jgi:hypothetical protein